MKRPATIGSFKESGNEFRGEIVTLSVEAKGVRIVPQTRRMSDNAPNHGVFVGRAEMGAAWSKRSGEGRDHRSVKLDEPSFRHADLAPTSWMTFCRHVPKTAMVNITYVTGTWPTQSASDC